MESVGCLSKSERGSALANASSRVSLGFGTVSFVSPSRPSIISHASFGLLAAGASFSSFPVFRPSPLIVSPLPLPSPRSARLGQHTLPFVPRSFGASGHAASLICSNPAALVTVTTPSCRCECTQAVDASCPFVFVTLTPAIAQGDRALTFFSYPSRFLLTRSFRSRHPHASSFDTRALHHDRDAPVNTRQHSRAPAPMGCDFESA